MVRANLFFGNRFCARYIMLSAHVSVMRSLGKQVDDRLVSFLHQVVYSEQIRLAAIKVVPIRKYLVKDDSRISGKHLLVLFVTVD